MPAFDAMEVAFLLLFKVSLTTDGQDILVYSDVNLVLLDPAVSCRQVRLRDQEVAPLPIGVCSCVSNAPYESLELTAAALCSHHRTIAERG